MYKSLITLGFACLLGISLTLVSCSENATKSNEQEFVADDNSFKDFVSWKLEATNKGPDPALGMAHSGNDESVTRYVYIKNDANRVNGKFPIGTIIVKHSTNPSGTVNEFTAMVKRGNNFNPQGGDWEWFMLSSDGKIMVGDNNMPMRGANLMDGMCVGCHSAASNKDFVFSK